MRRKPGGRLTSGYQDKSQLAPESEIGVSDMQRITSVNELEIGKWYWITESEVQMPVKHQPAEEKEDWELNVCAHLDNPDIEFYGPLIEPNQPDPLIQELVAALEHLKNEMQSCNEYGDGQIILDNREQKMLSKVLTKAQQRLGEEG